MTVKNLKDILANVPDNYEILAYSDEYGASFSAEEVIVEDQTKRVYIEGC